MRIEKLQRTYDIEPVLVHFPLHPETPAEGHEMANRCGLLRLGSKRRGEKDEGEG